MELACQVFTCDCEFTNHARFIVCNEYFVTNLNIESSLKTVS